MNQQIEASFYHLRSGITIFPAQDEAIDLVLADLVSRVPAHFCLLTDTTGQVISAKGDRGQIDLLALGALVAGELAASQEIARLTSERQDYQMIMREGQKSHILISEAGRYLALFVQVPHHVPLGWARMLIQKAACRLADIVATLPEAETSSFMLSLEEQNELPDLIGDALKDLWME